MTPPTRASWSSSSSTGSRSPSPIDPLGDHPDEMWDDEDGLFLRRPAHAGRHRPADQGAVARRPAAAVRDHRGARDRADSLPEGHRAVAALLRAQRRPAGRHHRPARPGVEVGACLRSSTSGSCEASSNRCWTRNASSARTASARSLDGTWSTPTPSTIDGRQLHRRLRAGRVAQRHVRRETPTGAALSGSRPTSCSSARSSSSTSTTETTSGSSAPRAPAMR